MFNISIIFFPFRLISWISFQLIKSTALHIAYIALLIHPWHFNLCWALKLSVFFFLLVQLMLISNYDKSSFRPLSVFPMAPYVPKQYLYLRTATVLSDHRNIIFNWHGFTWSCRIQSLLRLADRYLNCSWNNNWQGLFSSKNYFTIKNYNVVNIFLVHFRVFCINTKNIFYRIQSQH